MPTYEYACRACGHTFEIVQSMQDDSLTVCPECGGALRKVFAPPAISFKGSGFYATDHGKQAKGASSDKDGKDKKTDTKTDKKTEPKAEPKAGAGGEAKKDASSGSSGSSSSSSSSGSSGSSSPSGESKKKEGPS